MLYLIKFGEIRLSELSSSQEKVFYPSFNSNADSLWYKISEGMGVRNYYMWMPKTLNNVPVWRQLL